MQRRRPPAVEQLDVALLRGDEVGRSQLGDQRVGLVLDIAALMSGVVLTETATALALLGPDTDTRTNTD